MMSFEKEYKTRVKIEAEIICKDILENADKYDYEKHLYLNDVISAIRIKAKEFGVKWDWFHKMDLLIFRMNK